MKKYEIQTQFLYGWENCWTDYDAQGNETKTMFNTREEAQAALDDFVADGLAEVEAGNIVDAIGLEDLRVVEVEA